jgi:hypothetical protein
MLITESIVKDITLKESSQFIINKLGDSYVINLSESFKKCFPDEISTYNDYLISKFKKIYENISIYKINDLVVIRGNKKSINEAEYQGKDIELNQPSKGDVKKYKVFVKDPSTSNIKKVNFGDKNMEIKRDNPKRKKSFRARHKCDTAKDKTSPRYWSCKFWSNTPVSELINEIIDPNSVEVNDFHKKNELSAKIWNNETIKMHEDVRKALLRIAKEFIEFAGLEEYKFDDITLTGSLANYNYTDVSDLDVHILMDFSQISDDQELVGEYLKNKKTLWNDNMPIKAKGYDVEMYVQDINESHASTGVYSLIDNTWNTKPMKEIIQLDTGNIQLKSADYMNSIDNILDSEHTESTIKEIERLFDKIKAMRKAGLDKDGEFSIENIVFKILRRNGYIEKLLDLKKNLITKKLTIENNV